MNRINYAWYAIILTGLTSSIGAADAREAKPKKERSTPYSNEEKAKERRAERRQSDREQRDKGFYRWEKKEKPE